MIFIGHPTFGGSEQVMNQTLNIARGLRGVASRLPSMLCDGVVGCVVKRASEAGYVIESVISGN